MKNNNGNNTLKWRVGQLEANYNDVAKQIDTIRTNDLPHIQNSLTSMKTRISILTVVNIGAIILAAVVSKIFMF